MKKSILKFCLLACIVLFSIACSNSVKLTGNEFLIEGTISGVEDSTVIRLVRWDGNTGMTIASDTIMNGRFMFKGEAISDPERMTVSPNGEGFPSMSLNVWVAPRSKIKIKGEGKLHPLWEVKSSVPYQKEENRYVNESRDIIAEQARISSERNDMINKIFAAPSREESLPYRNIVDSLDVISNALLVKKIYNDIPIMEKANINSSWLIKMRNLAFVVRDQNEYYNLDAEQAGYLREKALELYGRMSEEDRNSLTGYPITADLFPPDVVEVGDNFTDVDLLDADGNTKRLADYSGKYLLLDFWSRGCGPCIMALPEMKEISETYLDKLTIISISLDTESVWKEAMAKHDMPWVNIRDPKSMGGLAASYGVVGIPNYVMISPEGTIVDKWAGFGTGYLKRKVGENIDRKSVV